MSDQSVLTAKLRLQVFEPRGQWQAALIPVAEFPLPEADCLPVSLMLQALTHVLRTTCQLHHLLSLQVWKLGPLTGAELISTHRREWKPQLGLGIWPTRTPPSGWTEARMMDAAAAALRGDEPELPAHRLLRLDQAEPGRGETARMLRPFGILMEMFTRVPENEVLRKTQETFAPRVAGSSFKDQDFYLPLLDLASFTAASAEELDEWLCFADFYVRDSSEDRGILLLSRLPLQPLLKQVAVHLQS